MQVSIENLTVNFPSGQNTIVRAFIESLLRMPDSPQEGEMPSDPFSGTAANQNTPPKIGDYWPGQGGIYAGMARGRDGEADYPLVLSTEAPGRDFNWQEALDHAKTITAEGRSDFTVPTRFESALLYANLQDQFDTDYSYWTSTQFSEGNAWNQYFYNGSQSTTGKDYERRCRFVRRLNPLTL
jgi:hypothetical protein